MMPATLPLLWLGSRAVQENWQLPEPFSFLNHLVRQLDEK
eukprot:gene53243-65032_t